MGSGSSRRRSRGGAPGSPGRAGGSPAAAGAGGGSPGAQDSAAEDADWRLLQEVLAECEEAAAPAPPAAQPVGALAPARLRPALSPTGGCGAEAPSSAPGKAPARSLLAAAPPGRWSEGSGSGSREAGGSPGPLAGKAAWTRPGLG